MAITTPEFVRNVLENGGMIDANEDISPEDDLKVRSALATVEDHLRDTNRLHQALVDSASPSENWLLPGAALSLERIVIYQLAPSFGLARDLQDFKDGIRLLAESQHVAIDSQPVEADHFV